MADVPRPMEPAGIPRYGHDPTKSCTAQERFLAPKCNLRPLRSDTGKAISNQESGNIGGGEIFGPLGTMMVSAPTNTGSVKT